MADAYGMCFGVRDAIDLAVGSPHRSDLTVLGELVHNPQVLERLRAAGVRIAPALDAPVETGHVMITAHGASEVAVRNLRERGLQVLQATCPLVRHAHRSLERLVNRGYFPVIIGKRNHVEVRGLAEDFPGCVVLERVEEIGCLAGHARIGVISQTTQPLSLVLDIVDRIRAEFPQAEVRFADTVCQPTKERQAAARRLACDCEVVVVVGGRNSNNTRQLVTACQAEGARAYQVESAAELKPEWFTGAETVGITAGTSTPDDALESVRRALEELGETVAQAA